MANEVNPLSGVQPSGNFQYTPYTSSMYDLDETDLNYGMYPMSMNGSIFGGADMMMPMAGCYGGMNNTSYFNNMKDYQKFYVDYNIDQQKMQRNADLKINGSVEGIQTAAANLKDKILQNEQDQIQEAYKAYEDSVRAAYGEGSDQEIRSRALTLYTSMNGGKSLIQDLRENSHGSATQGFIQSLSFGMYDRHSAEDNISDITGQPVGTGEKTKQNVGRIAGAGTIGGIVYGIAKALKSGKAGIIGLATAGVIGLISFISGKATT